jgi:hypothetical protein
VGLGVGGIARTAVMNEQGGRFLEGSGGRGWDCKSVVLQEQRVRKEQGGRGRTRT